MTQHLTRKEIAEELGVSPRTIENWDRKGIGPPRIKVNQTIRYPKDKYEEWKEQKLSEGTGDEDARASA